MTGPPVALVTGGARRVGAAIVRALHGAGHDVAVHHRHSAEDARTLVDALCTERPGSAFALAADLAEDDGPADLAAALLAARGRCDVLVNNASAFFETPVGRFDAVAWDALVGSNLRGPLFLTQALAPALREAGGAIVNLVDVHAWRPLPGYPVYSAAKAGLLMATRSLALELAPEVRVNAVAPGAILWPEGEDWETRREALLARVPLGRTGRPEDVADAVCFLARTPYVTGQVLAVDGGLSIG